MRKYPVSEIAFQIIDESEGIEHDKDFFNEQNVETDSKELLKNISKEVIMEFLGLDDTKVWAVKNDKGEYDIIAHNSVSKENVRLSGLGNHFMALVKIVKRANRYTENLDMPLLDNQFIKDINLQILLHREGEAGVGEYRYLDFLGRPIKMGFGKIVDGMKVRTGKCVDLEPSDDKNVYKKMNGLVKWVNTEAFKDPEHIMEDVAKFHAEFCRIHPFHDGNGRTCRLITDYLLLTQGQNMINVPSEDRTEYVLCLNYANARSNEDFKNENDMYREFYEKMTSLYGERNEKNKYQPLTAFLKSYVVTNSNNLINTILDYKGTNLKRFLANQIP